MDKINYENAKIIIIDDNNEVLESYKDALEFERMNVITFSNPVEGLEYLKNNELDVLLLDYYMPEMNGSEFVSELRKFNNKTIVILQTGYADKVPPLEMIDSINIQGYVDKNEGIEKIILTTKSAIKTARLMQEIRKKEDEVKRLTYKKALIGELISMLVNESKDQLFKISLANGVIKEDTDDYKAQNEGIDDGITKIYKLYDALNFEYKKEMSIKDFKETICQLLKAKLLINKSNLSFEIEDENIVINNPTELIYLMVKAIDLLVDSNSNTIKTIIKENDTIISIEINADIELDSINIEEIELIKENQDILILIDGNVMKINIKKQ